MINGVCLISNSNYDFIDTRLNKMADSDYGLRHHYLFNLPIAKCI